MSCTCQLRTYEIMLESGLKEETLTIQGHELEAKPKDHPSEIRVIVIDDQVRRVVYWSQAWRVRAIRDVTPQGSRT